LIDWVYWLIIVFCLALKTLYDYYLNKQRGSHWYVYTVQRDFESPSDIYERVTLVCLYSTEGLWKHFRHIWEGHTGMFIQYRGTLKALQTYMRGSHWYVYTVQRDFESTSDIYFTSCQRKLNTHDWREHTILYIMRDK